MHIPGKQRQPVERGVIAFNRFSDDKYFLRLMLENKADVVWRKFAHPAIKILSNLFAILANGSTDRSQFNPQIALQ
ncbi:hypothetical protein D3C86_2140610 [compost metagenome]